MSQETKERSVLQEIVRLMLEQLRKDGSLDEGSLSTLQELAVSGRLNDETAIKKALEPTVNVEGLE